MFTLKGRQDGFRVLLPKEFIPDVVNEKYTKLLTDAHSFITNPIDLINESIQKVDVFGFTGAAQTVQYQTMTGEPTLDPSRIEENRFLYGGNATAYRSFTSPVSIVDKTLNIDFRHQLGYLNYMIMFESFMYQYSRDYKNSMLPQQFNIDVKNARGGIYARIVLYKPIIDGMDMLSFDYTQPVAQSQSFRVVWKYSNFDYQLLTNEN